MVSELMNLSNMFRLITRAAIWGASFLFMRIAAPSMGAAVLIEVRVALAAICLLLISLYLKRKLAFRKYYKHFLHAGFMSLDHSNGEIRAWVGGVSHKYFKYDHVYQGKRQPGSTFKPIVYATILGEIGTTYSPKT